MALIPQITIRGTDTTAARKHIPDAKKLAESLRLQGRANALVPVVGGYILINIVGLMAKIIIKVGSPQDPVLVFIGCGIDTAKNLSSFVIYDADGLEELYRGQTRVAVGDEEGSLFGTSKRGSVSYTIGTVIGGATAKPGIVYVEGSDWNTIKFSYERNIDYLYGGLFGEFLISKDCRTIVKKQSRGPFDGDPNAVSPFQNHPRDSRNTQHRDQPATVVRHYKYKGKEYFIDPASWHDLLDKPISPLQPFHSKFVAYRLAVFTRDENLAFAHLNAPNGSPAAFAQSERPSQYTCWDCLYAGQNAEDNYSITDRQVYCLTRQIRFDGDYTNSDPVGDPELEAVCLSALQFKEDKTIDPEEQPYFHREFKRSPAQWDAPGLYMFTDWWYLAWNYNHGDRQLVFSSIWYEYLPEPQSVYDVSMPDKLYQSGRVMLVLSDETTALGVGGIENPIFYGAIDLWQILELEYPDIEYDFPTKHIACVRSYYGEWIMVVRMTHRDDPNPKAAADGVIKFSFIEGESGLEVSASVLYKCAVDHAITSLRFDGDGKNVAFTEIVRNADLDDPANPSRTKIVDLKTGAVTHSFGFSFPNFADFSYTHTNLTFLT